MVQVIETEHLERCPFCGGKAELKVAPHALFDEVKTARVECTGCHTLSNTVTTGESLFTGHTITLDEAIKKAANSWNKRADSENRLKNMENQREDYIKALPAAEVTPMLEAVKLYEYSKASETVFCKNMAHLYGCVPLKADGNNLCNFLVTLYHYGKVQGIRAERARRKGGTSHV